ncbi:MAG TPA: hypothetical protein VI231_03450 [Candidatus Binatia bacterium]
MARPMTAYTEVHETELRRDDSAAAFQAYGILLFAFTIAPIIAGADKFFGILTNWTQYLAPVFPNTLGIDPATFMMIVGAIEIIAGIIVFLKPSVGGYIVSLWLLGIIVNLLLLRNFYDIALRDLGLLLGALALARLGTHFGR